MVVMLLILFAFLLMFNTTHINKRTTDAEIEFHIEASVVNENFNTLNETDNGRTYNSFLDFPYLNMPFANDEVYELYKDAYNKIDFYGEFRKGDSEVHDYYKERYYQLLNNERDFTNPKTGEEILLNEFTEFKTDADKNIYDLSNYTYYFFDMSGDNIPELGITNRTTYIFKYIPETDEFILWCDLTPSYQLIGSQKIIWIHLGTGMGLAFYKLGENGEEEYSTFCYSTNRHNEKSGETEDVYIVGLPRYIDNQIETAVILEKEAYKDSYGTLYFRVTRKQYDELTKNIVQSQRLAEENIKEVAFTYDELFE